MAEEIKAKYLIIGNSAGGIGAIEAIRLVDKAGSITLISEEPYPAYSRPMISDIWPSTDPGSNALPPFDLLCEERRQHDVWKESNKS